MATSFNKNYTELTTINSGNQIQDGDTILGEHITDALQNTAHFKELTNNMVVRNAVVSNGKLILTLATKGNNDASATIQTLELDASSFSGVPIQIDDGQNYTKIIHDGEKIHLEVYEYIGGELNDDKTHTIEITSDDIKSIIKTYNDDEGVETVTKNLIKDLYYVNIKVAPQYVTSNFDADISVVVLSDKPVTSMTQVKNSTSLYSKIMATGLLKFNGTLQSVYRIEFQPGNIIKIYWFENNAEYSYTYSINVFNASS